MDVIYQLHPPPYVNGSLEKPDTAYLNDIIYWKNYDPKNQVPYGGAELLTGNIFSAVQSGKWQAYQYNDSPWKLGNPNNSIYKLEADTIVVFDVETGEETVAVVRIDLKGISTDAILTKQVLYFDEKKGDFELFTRAIAPAFLTHTEYYDNTFELPSSHLLYYIPFWLKMPEFSKKKAKMPKINDPDITWAAQVRTLGNSPELNKLSVLKNTKPPVMQILLDRFVSDPTYKAENSLGGLIPFKDRDALICKHDTVVEFYPETYEEKVVTTVDTINATQANRLRLIEHWY